jgi:hypothetical protein
VNGPFVISQGEGLIDDFLKCVHVGGLSDRQVNNQMTVSKVNSSDTACSYMTLLNTGNFRFSPLKAVAGRTVQDVLRQINVTRRGKEARERRP